MSEPSIAEQYFEQYGLKDIEHIPDAEKRLYRAMGLKMGRFSQLYGLKVWARGYKLVKESEHNLSLNQLEDNRQMPGVFLIHKGKIVKQFIHRKISDRPDYKDLINYQVP